MKTSDQTPHVRIRQIGAAHVGQAVQVRGWLRNKPGGKGRYFLWLRDGSAEIQAIAEEEKMSVEQWALLESIGIESSIIVDGVVREHPKDPGVFELEFRQIRVIQAVTDYPLGKKEHGTQFLMKNRHLWLRGKRQSAILRIRSEIHKAWADFFYERGFFRVDTPIFTPNACEGTTTLFEVEYHGDTVYLSQSGQLYNEADIGALGQVYCFGPTFRAEKSKTRRHLLEFWMLEMEAAYYDLDDNIALQQDMIAFTVTRILERCMGDLADIWGGVRGTDKRSFEDWVDRLRPATQTPFPRIRYGEAIEMINRERESSLQKYQEAFPKATIVFEDESLRAMKKLTWEELREAWLSCSIREIQGTGKDSVASEDDDDDDDGVKKSVALPAAKPFRWGEDFGSPDETVIGAQFDRPVFVSNFPVEIKGFYFKDELDESGQCIADPVFLSLPESMKEEGSSGFTVLGADLIGNEGAGEIIGGSQREDDFARLMEKVEHHKLPMEEFQWYLDCRRFGNVPHSGFGIGMERFTAWVCGGTDTPVHIREVITFPRMLHQYRP
jgi:asparaginyl-tRNA synthetase